MSLGWFIIISNSNLMGPTHPYGMGIDLDLSPYRGPDIDLSALKAEARDYQDEPWLQEARATPRRMKRGLPAYKPAPQRTTRRPCY